MPDWVKSVLDCCIKAGKITSGKIFCRANKAGSFGEPV